MMDFFDKVVDSSLDISLSLEVVTKYPYFTLSIYGVVLW
jgi:hypothetical protein